MATVTKPIALDRSLNTTESPSRNIADVLAEELSRITGRNASQVEYDNTESGLDADNVQDALDEINGKIPTVPSVDIQTAVDEFETYNGGLLSSLKVSLSPNQDLHGYDSPWVGGAGKNKLHVTGVNNTINGVTFTVNTDADGNVISISANGTASATIIYEVSNDVSLSALSYILNGCPSGGSGTTFALRVGNSSYSTVFDDYGVGANVSNDYAPSMSKVAIIIRNGYTANNLVFYPMIRLSTESDPTFEPYSNICPISGHTQVDVDVSDGQATQEQVTVNLGGTYYSGTLDVVTGVFVPDTAKYVLTDVSKLEEFGTSQYGAYAKIKVSEYPSIKEDISLELASLCIAVTYEDRIAYSHDNRFFIDGNKVYIRASSDENVTTVNELFAIFENCEFVLPLATPTPIQLSPTMVKALVGENHLSAPLEGQEITESKYKQMFTFDDVIAYIQSLS